jgi:pimeloyl-ACP methyl ester carboxylesterase
MQQQQQHQGPKNRNAIIKNSLCSHPSSWDDLADAPPNTDVGDGSCVMSHLGMRLEDGRWLAFELQGDPDGIPVLCVSMLSFFLKKYLTPVCMYFHGLLGSRLESNFDAQSSLVHGILFISVDRPGYGLSTYSPKRSYLDFVEDIEQLLNYLALPKVLVIGFSSGGPYALACAARIPERLIGCSVVSSDLPYADLAPELVRELKGDLKSLNTVFNVAKVLRCF